MPGYLHNPRKSYTKNEISSIVKAWLDDATGLGSEAASISIHKTGDVDTTTGDCKFTVTAAYHIVRDVAVPFKE